VHQEQSRLVVDSSLQDVSLAATLGLPAVLGPMAGPTTVVAGVVAGDLALTGATTTSASMAPGSLALLAEEPLLLYEEKLATNGDRPPP
jgi:hypothetical protein